MLSGGGCYRPFWLSSRRLLVGKQLVTKYQGPQKQFSSVRQQQQQRQQLHNITYRPFSKLSEKIDDVELKKWDMPMLESNGDYRDEKHVEDRVGGPLYEHQSSLPKLPIPSVEETIDRFLPTALPLAETKEEEMSLRAACDAFLEQSKSLQERLKNRKDDEQKDSSWLQPWWNQLGYLQVRDSVVINVSYFFHFADDPTIDRSSSTANVQRAAALLYSTAEFRKMVISGQLPTEKVGKAETPLCSTAYKYMFNACRIPKEVQDSYRIYDPSLHTHAVVARKGHFFSIELVDSQSGNPLPLNVLEDQLTQCMTVADTIPSQKTKFGLHTSLNRDTWAATRQQLLDMGGVSMKDALEKLESGAVLINLDDEEPLSRDECCELLLSGGEQSGENRWFDKSIQIIIANNGKTGILGEHSMMDGMPLVNYANYITSSTYEEVKERSKQNNNDGGSGSSNYQVDEIFGNVSVELDPKIEIDAWKEFQGEISKQSNTAQSFQAYGSTFMKQAGHSPDAYVQVAMQLATYRLFGKQQATYEATQVRPFLHGRTETTRSVSLESEAFVQMMGRWPKTDENENNVEIRQKKLDLLQQATKAHSAYTKAAAAGNGVDRHLFGLSMLVDENEPAPDLFSDPVFLRSKRWRISTSHLTHPKFVNWGFGQVVPDGVGIAYSILPKSCVFNVTALHETGWAVQLSELLEEALLEMQSLIEAERKNE